jgi:UDP-N-acetylglucosamine acyltransferase
MIQIDSTALVSPNAIIGKNVKIGAYSIVYDNVVIRDNVEIGEHCIIGAEPESVLFFGQKSQGVLIDEGTKITKQVTIDSGTQMQTYIGKRCLLLKNAHVGHDSYICDEVQLRCNVIIGGHCEIGYKSMFGLGSICHQRKQVPECVVVGMGTVITKKTKLEAGCTYVGSPAKKLCAE